MREMLLHVIIILRRYLGTIQIYKTYDSSAYARYLLRIDQPSDQCSGKPPLFGWGPVLDKLLVTKFFFF